MKALGLGAIAAAVALLVILGLIVPVSSINHDLRVEPASAALGCTASGTSCTITLPSDHEHFDTTHMTVTETSPGAADRTATSIVDARDRNDIAVSGLVDLTAYTFTVDYEEQSSSASNDLEDILRLFPVMLVGVFVVGIFVVFAVGIVKFLGKSGKA